MAQRIALANGRGVAVVDDDDAAAVRRHSWCLHNGRYAASRIDGKLVLMHRFVLGLAVGDPRQVDHVDNDAKLDNRRANLRIVTRAQNAQNLSPRAGCSSAFRGVSRCGFTGRWRAVATLDGRYRHIGRFDSEQEAAEAAAEWRAEHMPFAA